MIDRIERDDALWPRAARAFDEEDAALGDDSAAAQRVLARLQADPPRVSRPRRIRPLVLLAAAGLMVASIAGAVVSVVRHRESATPPPVASLVPVAPRAVEPASAEPASVEPLPALTSESAAPSASPIVEDVPSEPQLSAVELLSAAGQARRQGQNGQAMRLLERLQTRYPGSAEAQASDITLGMLRLQGGSPGVALGAFDRYLQRSPGGARAADALWGRAQALNALGRTAEAKKSLETLLARYPNSPYTSAAEAKLRGAKP